MKTNPAEGKDVPIFTVPMLVVLRILGPCEGLTCPSAQGIVLIMLNPLKLELNPICYLLALLGAHHFLHVSRIRVKLLTLRRLMSYIYIWNTRQGRSPAEILGSNPTVGMGICLL